jgi:hypothetical protein
MCTRRQAQDLVNQCSIITKNVIVKPYTIVEIEADLDGKLYRAVGLAKVGKRDIWNPDTGYQVAKGRAIVDIIKRAKLVTH